MLPCLGRGHGSLPARAAKGKRPQIRKTKPRFCASLFIRICKTTIPIAPFESAFSLPSYAKMCNPFRVSWGVPFGCPLLSPVEACPVLLAADFSHHHQVVAAQRLVA